MCVCVCVCVCVCACVCGFIYNLFLQNLMLRSKEIIKLLCVCI